MKYSLDILIDLPRQEVISKLDSVENIKHWQRGLVGVEHLSGTPGEVGAKMKLSYKFGSREMQMVETITKRDFPKEFHATYETKGMHTVQQNFFEETSEGQTKWTSNSEFITSGFGMKLMAFLMPGAFKKQSNQYLEDFKNFAEKGISVSEN